MLSWTQQFSSFNGRGHVAVHGRMRLLRASHAKLRSSIFDPSLRLSVVYKRCCYSVADGRSHDAEEARVPSAQVTKVRDVQVFLPAIVSRMTGVGCEASRVIYERFSSQPLKPTVHVVDRVRGFRLRERVLVTSQKLGTHGNGGCCSEWTSDQRPAFEADGL